MLLCTKSFYWSKRCEGTNRCKGEANCTWSTGAIGQVFLLCLLQFFEGKSVLVCEEGHLMTSCQGSSTICRVQVYTGNEGWWSSTPLQALLWQHRKVEKEPWQPWREKKISSLLETFEGQMVFLCAKHARVSSPGSHIPTPMKFPASKRPTIDRPHSARALFPIESTDYPSIRWALAFTCGFSACAYHFIVNAFNVFL